MSQITQKEIDEAKTRTMSVYINSIFIGLIEEGSLSITLENKVTVLDNIHQMGGIFKSITSGVVPKMKAKFVSSGVDFISDVAFKDRLEVDVNGIEKTVWFGIKDVDNRANAHTVLLHPYGVDLEDKSNDWTFHLGASVPDSVELVFERTKFQTIDLEFTFFPDITQPTGKHYGFMGSGKPAQTPLSVFPMASNKLVSIPPKSLESFDQELSDVQLSEWYIMNGEDSAITLLVDEIAGYASAKNIVSIKYDGLTVPNGLLVGSYLKGILGNEFLYVLSVVPTSSTTGTFTCIREVCGSVLEAYANNDLFTVLKNVSFQRMTPIVSLVSSAPAVVSVGNSESLNNKGIISCLAGGVNTTTITGTVNGKASKVLTVNTV